MENSDHEAIQLPPGFRFHPTDEELITHYLSPKLLDPSFSPLAISHADFNNSDPWDLPWRATMMGEKQRYFFCVRDRKYPTGLRTNRATHSGYWKATGKDKEIFTANTLIGMKKTLVFYRGRAPRGAKTNWVTHEYRLHHPHHQHHLIPSKNEWVLCRVFQKVKAGIGGASELPPLMEGSPNQTEFGEPSHVTCFSDPNHNEAEDPMSRRDIADSGVQVPDSFQLENENSGWGDLDGDISSVLYNSSNHMIQNQPFSSGPGPLLDDLGCLWNYSS